MARSMYTIHSVTRGCIGYHFDGLLRQLLDALHPLVLFIAMWLTSEDAGYDCFIVQELCENRGGRPGLSRPNEPSGFRGRKDLLNRASALVTTCP